MGKCFVITLLSYVTVLRFMLQLNFVFDNIIYPRRVTISESFYLITEEITQNTHKGFVK